jgi:hypothetical protein
MLEAFDVICGCHARRLANESGGLFYRLTGAVCVCG